MANKSVLIGLSEQSLILKLPDSDLIDRYCTY